MVPAEQMVANDGTGLADAATIDRVLVKAGAKTKGRQISFSNNGRLASGTWFMLHEVKGKQVGGTLRRLNVRLDFRYPAAGGERSAQLMLELICGRVRFTTRPPLRSASDPLARLCRLRRRK